jgi:excisionase family DNA binding protein
MTQDNKDNQDIQRIYMTFQEAQKFLGVSHQTIYRLMKQGLASHKIGKKRVFLKEELVQWIRDH